MTLRRFTAPTVDEAMKQVVAELGRDAYVVEVKTVKKGGFLGLLAKRMVEVTAVKSPPVRQAAAGSRPGADQNALIQELSVLKGMMAQLLTRTAEEQGKHLRGMGHQVYELLLARGVSSDVAARIGEAVSEAALNGESLSQTLQTALFRLLHPLQPLTLLPNQRKVVALVGPTGAGKTTTVAKLAAKFSLEQGRKVALITTDTYRIAAIEQLRTYAEIMDVPFFAADKPDQIAEALRKTADCDLVLVDTGGRNHRDSERMRELKESLAVIRPDETHLVLSLTTSPMDANAILDHYLPLGVNRIAFSKVDETTSPGTILNVRQRCQLPISFITNGQRVPEDIVSADRCDFGKLLLGV